MVDELSTELGALRWCRAKNARVRFESNQTVTVYVNGRQRRRPTLAQAVTALAEVLRAG